MTRFNDPRFVIAMLLMTLFAWSYWANPTETKDGAVIMAFAAAWGYYLNSSNSTNSARDQVGKALDIAAANAPTPPRPDAVLKPGETAQALPATNPSGEAEGR